MYNATQSKYDPNFVLTPEIRAYIEKFTMVKRLKNMDNHIKDYIIYITKKKNLKKK